MGCFDTIHIPCPGCGHPYQAQSKGGACALADYTLLDCPQDVLSDVNRHAPFMCNKCGAWFQVVLTPHVMRVE